MAIPDNIVRLMPLLNDLTWNLMLLITLKEVVLFLQNHKKNINCTTKAISTSRMKTTCTDWPVYFR